MNFHPELISFFQNHNLYDKEMFDYFAKNTQIIDYKDEEQRYFIGCFYVFNKKNILRKIHLNLPYIYDEITMLINIHEIIHGIELYKKLNRKTQITEDCEVLPILYEKIYIEEKNTQELREYQKKLDNSINENEKQYLLALAVRDELYKQYNYNYQEIKRKAKKLSKKHQFM